MTIQESIRRMSELLHREVRYVKDIDSLPGVTAELLRNYDSYGHAVVIAGDGSVDVAFRGTSDAVAAVLPSIVYNVVRKEGVRGLFRSDDDMVRFAAAYAGSVAESDGGSYEARMGMPRNIYDARAYLSGCAGREEVLRHALAYAMGILPEDVGDRLVMRFRKGIKANAGYRKAQMPFLDDEEALSDLALEALSPFSDERFVSLGGVAGAYADMKFPVGVLSIAKSSLERMSRYTGKTIVSLIGEGLVGKLRRPLAVVRGDGSKDSPGKTLRVLLDLRSKDGTLMSVEMDDFGVSGPKHVLSDGALIVGLRNVNPMGLKRLADTFSFRIADDRNPNLVYMKAAEDNKYSYEIYKVFRNIVDEIEKRRVTASASTLAERSLTATLRNIAKIPLNFDNTKNFSKIDDILFGGSFDEALEAARSRDAVPAEPPQEANVAVVTPLLPSVSRAEILSRKVDYGYEIGGAGVFTKSVMEKLLCAGLDTNAVLLSEFRRLSGKEVVTKNPKTGRTSRMNGFVDIYGPKAYGCVQKYLSARGLLEMKSVVRARVSEKELNALSPQEVSYKCFFNNLKACPESVEPGSVAMPRRVGGRYFEGADVFQLVADVAALPRWKGCNVFLSKDELGGFGINALSSAEPVYLSSGEGPVYNLMDTDMDDDLKDAVREDILKDSVAVPVPVLSYLRSLRSLSEEQVPGVVGHLDSGYRRLVDGYWVKASGLSLETSMKDCERRLIEAAEHSFPTPATVFDKTFTASYNHRLDRMLFVEDQGAAVTVMNALGPASGAEVSVKGKLGKHGAEIVAQLSSIARIMANEIKNRP